MRRDPPTCRPDDLVDDAMRASQAADWPVCLVVNDANIVLGRLRGERLRPGAERVAE